MGWEEWHLTMEENATVWSNMHSWHSGTWEASARVTDIHRNKNKMQGELVYQILTYTQSSCYYWFNNVSYRSCRICCPTALKTNIFLPQHCLSLSVVAVTTITQHWRHICFLSMFVLFPTVTWLNPYFPISILFFSCWTSQIKHCIFAHTTCPGI